MTALWWLLGFVVLQRLAELAYARRNERRLRADGAVEHGSGHYPLIVLLHAAWLAAIGWFVPAATPPNLYWLGLFGLLQLARVWVLASMGRFWTTRIITLPDAPLVRRGPYRWVRHPNYLIVAAEIAVVPAIFGAWTIAILFSIANGILLAWRIRVEEAALAPRRDVTI
jgi:methyltransferase